ncbi:MULTISPECIES: EF-hand domain-containing protein [unclassified Streptomyces]|uniref:EF-hand domain-containing protein n=1 Tax=unclassified Streptomyces TaxID=2593676 RepID=UPI0033EEADB9
MTTSVQLDRIKTRFDSWDVNGDGRIDRADFDAESKRILRAFGEAPGSPRSRVLSEAYLGMWNFFAGKAGIDKENGRLTAEQFHDIVKEHVLENGGTDFGKAVKPTVQAMIELADVDDDDQISPTEFKTWLDAMGVENIDPADAFRQMQTNGDDQLSADELVQAVRAYHLGEIDVPLLGH